LAYLRLRRILKNPKIGPRRILIGLSSRIAKKSEYDGRIPFQLILYPNDGILEKLPGNDPEVPVE
jgi:hypothetical protein